MQRLFNVCFLVGIILSVQIVAQEYPRDTVFYVSPDGNDQWSGSLPAPNSDKTDGPFPSLQNARDAIRDLKKQGNWSGSVTVMIREGDYTLDEPLIFEPQDSGEKDKPIIYKSYPGDKVRILGAKSIKANWQPYKGQIKVTRVPDHNSKKWIFNQLFVNGKRQTRARTPNKDFFRAYQVPDESDSSFIYSAGDINENWKNLHDIQIVIFHKWSESRMFISSIDPQNRQLNFTGHAAYALDHFEKYPRYWVENLLEALDQPGEWYLDKTTGELYFWPPDNLDLSQADIVAPITEQLVFLDGNSDTRNPIQHISFENIIWSYTGYEFPETGFANGGGATGPRYTPSAILLEHANNINIKNCLFENVATYTIELTDSCSQCLIENNVIRYAGGGGVIIINGTDNSAINNHIHHCGKIFFGGTGVVNPSGIRTHIAHNLIHDMPYCGIRGGNWGIELNELIEYNHVHHVMQELDDGAGIFNCGIGSVIRNNLVHDSYGFARQGWALYLDEFRTGVRMEKNIAYNTRTGGLHLHNNYGHTIVNNIFAFSKTGQISWTRFHGIHFSKRKAKYRHPLHVFQNNIVYYTEGVFSYNLDCNRWDLATKPELIDYNLYYKASGDHRVTMGIGHGGKPGYDSFEDWQEFGLDQHSMVADPMFVDPQKGDFTLKPKSPAFKLGFIPIDTSQIGLKDNNVGPKID